MSNEKIEMPEEDRILRHAHETGRVILARFYPNGLFDDYMYFFLKADNDEIQDL